VLREVSLVLAEDTRHTRKLLSHFGVSTRLLSYHQHNKLIRLERILQELQGGDVALVSDSGMPSVSDPGFELIRAAVDAGIEVDVLPGPSAAVTAVVAAALPGPGFLFMGFLPRSAGERRKRLEEVERNREVLVLYEAPHRLLATLGDLRTVLGDREMVAARELTKVHQELERGRVSALEERFTERPPRGELTLVVAGATSVVEKRAGEAEALLRHLHGAGEDRRSALATVVRETGVARNDAYRLWLRVSGEAAETDNTGSG
jgi:16S rRNA (cytidine1402-2'-O)-methyltransferase